MTLRQKGRLSLYQSPLKGVFRKGYLKRINMDMQNSREALWSKSGEQKTYEFFWGKDRLSTWTEEPGSPHCRSLLSIISVRNWLWSPGDSLGHIRLQSHTADAGVWSKCRGNLGNHEGFQGWNGCEWFKLKTTIPETESKRLGNGDIAINPERKDKFKVVSP